MKGADGADLVPPAGMGEPRLSEHGDALSSAKDAEVAKLNRRRAYRPSGDISLSDSLNDVTGVKFTGVMLDGERIWKLIPDARVDGVAVE
mmetsp:Transcript_34457/g.100015  ORF Transcript_34457/g.100015 Transcript_34457/m.100015 type:complete len:90 (+) Transcript_34457:41-310(+)